MSDQHTNDVLVEASDYPPLLNAVIPILVLVLSLVYAWSLRDIVNPDMNLLLLRPLFIIIWLLVAVVMTKDVIPSIRMHRRWLSVAAPGRLGWGDLLVPGTEANAGMVVIATFALALFGPGHGALAYVIAVFIYLAVTGYLLNDRHVGKLLVQAALCTMGLYFIMGVALGVRL